VFVVVGSLAACGSNHHAVPPDSITVAVTAAAGGGAQLDRASIEIPPHAIATDAKVTIVRLTDPVPTGTGPAYAFHVDPAQPVLLPFTLHLPSPVGFDGTDTPVFLSFRGDDGWTSVAATWEGHGTVRAEVEHLSDWRSFDPLGWLKNVLTRFTAQLDGGQAAAKPCTGGHPGANILGLPANAPISVCVRPAAAGHATVTVSNRRQFAFALTPQNLTPDRIIGPDGRVDLPSGGEIAFDLLLDGRTAWLKYQPDAAYTAIEKFWPAALAGGLGLTSKAAGDLVNANDMRICLAKTPATSNFGAGIGDSLDCLVAHLKSADANMVKTILRHLPLGVVAAMASGEATGTLTIEVATTLPAVGPSAPRSIPTTAPAGTTPGTSTSTTSAAPPAPANRYGVTSYDRLAPGAMHAEWYQAWQDFTAASNTITRLAVNVGDTRWAPGRIPVTAALKLCRDAACAQLVGGWQTQINNYGTTAVDIGDVAVQRGATYYLRFDRPDSSHTWAVYFWGPGTYNQFSATVQGYNQ
jgi:hypothetical protein